jgi:aryl-alcohol dehydrogenase-like predicted oxidoreductase
MQYVTFGETGERLSQIGFGCSAIGGHEYGPANDHDSIAAIHHALDLGINFFDVADVYGLGHSERVLGEALQQKSNNAFIATKVGVRWDERGRTTKDLSRDYIEQALKASLRRLQVECIQLYQIHWPDARTPIEDVMETLTRCRDAGWIRHIGCCNFDKALLDRAETAGEMASLQIPFSLIQPEAGDYAATESKRGLLVQAYNVLGRGLLTGKFRPGASFSGTDTRSRSELFRPDAFKRAEDAVRRLTAIAQRRNKTPSQVAIRWVLDRGGVGIALTGIRSVSQAEQNAGSAGWSLERSEVAFLEGAGD